MKKILFGILSVLVLTGAFLAYKLLTFNNVPVAEASIYIEYPDYICHWDYGKRVYSKTAYAIGHLIHIHDIIPPFGLYGGKNWDEDGQALWRNNCEPVEEPSYYYVCEKNSCVQVEGEGESSCEVDEDCLPEPTPTQEPTPTPVVETKRETSMPGAPVCTNGVPAVVPLNAHVVRNGSDATVNAHIPEGDKVNIYYKENDASDWRHAVADVSVEGKYVSYTIHDLDPNTGYTFAIQAANGCAGGEVVLAVVIDPPANGKTFMFSHYEWLH